MRSSVLALCWLVHSAFAVQSPPVRASIQASWSEAPFLVQILESVSIENEGAVFDLFSPLSRLFSPSQSDQQLYTSVRNVLEQSESLQHVGALEGIEFSLASKEASPKIEAFYGHYSSLQQELGVVDGCFARIAGVDALISDSSRLDDALRQIDTNISFPPLSFDHVHPSKAAGLPNVIFYADPLHPNCASLYDRLYRAATSGLIRLTLRWKRSNTDPKPLILNGYGAYLDIKKSEYLVVDDRKIEESNTQPAASPVAGDIDEEEATEEIERLTRSQISTLGLKATQYILKANDTLTALVDVSQNFPKLSHRLASDFVSDLDDDMVAEIAEMQQTVVQAGSAVVWLNGLQLADSDLETYSLQRVMRQERRRIQELVSLGLTNQQAVDVLSHPAMSQAQSSQTASPSGQLTPDSLGTLFDASDRPEGGSVILWWNDIEKDKRYKSWPADIKEINRPLYPGQMPMVRKNLFNVVLALDFKLVSPYKVLTEAILPLIQRSMPFHIGVIPLIAEGDHLSQSMAIILKYLMQSFGKKEAVAFLSKLADSRGITIDFGTVEKIYEELLSSKTTLTDSSAPLSLTEVLAQDQQWVQQTKSYCRRLGLAATRAGHIFSNGKYASLENGIQRPLQTTIGLYMQYLQHAVHFRTLPDDFHAATHFYDLPSTFSRRNERIFDSESSLTLVDAASYQTWKPNAAQGDLGKARFILSIIALPSAPLALAAASLQLPDAITTVQDSWPPSAPLAASPNSSFVVVNARVFGPFQDQDLTTEDFQTLMILENKHRLAPLLEALESALVDIRELSDIDRLRLIAGATSVLAQSYIKDSANNFFDQGAIQRSNAFKQLPSQHIARMYGDERSAWARFVAVVDPLSRFAQRRSTIFQQLSLIPGISLQLYLNPIPSLRELPLTRFYRHTFTTSLHFDDNGLLQPAEVLFRGLPTKVLYTLGLEVLPSWLAFPLRSVYDLDNIRLSDLAPTAQTDGVSAMFALENIIIEGHCRETLNSEPPRGLQLELSSSFSSDRVDSLVMANLGYTQLKANPGSFVLSIRQGRSSKVFSLESAGTSGLAIMNGSVDLDNTIDVTSFEGTTVYPRFRRNPGMRDVDLLDDSTDYAGTIPLLGKAIQTWRSMTSSILPSSKLRKPGADINIFTVASGLLYERMAFLMVLSVLRHTESTVCFWFINNFLSPAFKSFIPHMAKHYGFEYRLITYKWPHWLRAQTEKQRTIWGYKILFLDVLFPLELDRVIFVDSDQIVRTDLKQLIDLDLKGAPYGYAPMGDDRAETDGFRFWKSGYWRDHLRGLPYHISALYVIDLDRFRQLAAGDILRQQYQALSADPNSLANLDQDLPNNLQHQIPIYTLDRSWLWCETWCSDESLADAKTIDLCNNPLTHEPKLDRAKRLIPEWTVYDAEIAELARNVSLLSAEDATAFVQEASNLGQAKLQQQEFVDEGKPAVDPLVVQPSKIKDEL